MRNNAIYNDSTTHADPIPELMTSPPGAVPHTYENVTSPSEASGNDTATYETIESPTEASVNDTATYEKLESRVEASVNDTVPYENVGTQSNTVTDNEYEYLGSRNEYERLRAH